MATTVTTPRIRLQVSGLGTCTWVFVNGKHVGYVFHHKPNNRWYHQYNERGYPGRDTQDEAVADLIATVGA